MDNYNQTQNRANDLHNPSLSGIQSQKSTHSEKVSQLELKYRTGTAIEYTDHRGQLQYALKTAPGQYIDLKTRRPLETPSIVEFLLKGREASTSMLSNAIRNNITEFMQEYDKRKLTIDFETAFIQNPKDIQASDVLSMSVGGTHPREAGKLMGADYYVTDVFYDMINDDPNIKSKAFNKFLSTSKNIKAGYFKRFKRVADMAGFDINNAKSMSDIIQRKDTFTKILNYMDQAESPLKMDPKGLGLEEGPKKNVNVAIGKSKFAEKFMRQTFDIPDNSKITLGGYNVGQVEENAMNAFGFFSKGNSVQYNLIDLRGNELLKLSNMFPHLTENMSTSLGPMMNEVAHRMRLSDKQTKAFFDKMDQGIGSFYRKGTSAEAIHESLRYAVQGYHTNSTRSQLHLSMNDVWEHMDQARWSDKVYKASMLEAINPELAIHSPRNRLLVGMMRYTAAETAVDESALRYMSKPKQIRKYLNRFDNGVNVKKLERMVTSNLESATAIRMESSFLKSNLKQFGGSTISHLLGGSLMLAGTYAAVRKVRERFADTRENNMEGLSHNSILTNMRRLTMTDFGSSYIGGLTNSFTILSQIMRNAITKPTGMQRIVRQNLKSINNTLQSYRGKGSYMQMLKDDRSMLKLTDDIMGQNGKMKQLFDELNAADYISEGVRETVNGTIEKVGNVVGNIFQERIGLNGAKKKINKSVMDAMSSLFVTRGKEGAKLTPSGWALSVGAVGAIGTMFMRGRYDPTLAREPLPTVTKGKRERGEKNRRNIRRRIQDLNNSSRDGIELGSRDRQQQRYSLTDFGSALSHGLKMSMLYARRLSTGLNKSVSGLFTRSRVPNIDARTFGVKNLSAKPGERLFTQLDAMRNIPMEAGIVDHRRLITGHELSLTKRIQLYKRMTTMERNTQMAYSKAISTADNFKRKLKGVKGIINEDKLRRSNYRMSNRSTKSLHPSRANMGTGEPIKANWKQTKKRVRDNYRNAITRDNPDIEATKDPRIRRFLRATAEGSSLGPDDALESVKIKVRPNSKVVGRKVAASGISPSKNVQYKKVTASSGDNFYSNPNKRTRATHVLQTGQQQKMRASDLFSVRKEPNASDIYNRGLGLNDPVIRENARLLRSNNAHLRRVLNDDFGSNRIMFRRAREAGIEMMPKKINTQRVKLKGLLPLESSKRLSKYNNRMKGTSVQTTPTSAVEGMKTKNNPVTITTTGLNKTPDEVMPLSPGLRSYESVEYLPRANPRMNKISTFMKDNALSDSLAKRGQFKRPMRYGNQSLPYLPNTHMDPRLEPGTYIVDRMRPWSQTY